MMMSRALVLLGLLGCPSIEHASVQPAHPTVAAEPPAAPPPPARPPPAPDGLRLAARELRVAWAGADGAAPSVVRTEPEARALAWAMHHQLLLGTSFSSLAASASDAPSGGRGGWLGPFETPLLDADLEAALAATAIGALTEPVRTSSGFHVLRREPLEEPLVLWVAVGWTGAHRATVRRTRSEANALAARAATALASGALPSAVVADALGPDDGERLGAYAWPPRALAAVYTLAEGDVTTVETTTGLWVVRRLPTPLPAPP